MRLAGAAALAALLASTHASAVEPVCGPSLPYGTLCRWESPAYRVHGSILQRGDAIPGQEMLVSVVVDVPTPVAPVQAFRFSIDVLTGFGSPCDPYDRFTLVVGKGEICQREPSPIR
jgi:hypothetical protein